MKTVKVLLPILFILFSVQKSDAQRYRTEKVRAYYVSFPMEPLSEEIVTYNSIINPGEIDFRFIEKDPPLVYTVSPTKNNYSSPEKCEEEYLSLRGYEKNAESPDITFTVDFDAINIREKKLQEKTGTFIENKQKVQRKMYLYDVTYSYGAKFIVQDKNGKVIFEEVFYNPEVTLTATVGDPIDGIGHNAFNIQELNEMMEKEFLGNYQKDKTKECLRKAEIKIKSAWAYALYYYDFSFATDKSTKKLNYDDLNLAVKIVTEAIEISNAEELKPVNELYSDKLAIESYCAKFDEAIGIWQKALEEADYEDRQARIHNNLAPMLYCNIATAAILKKDWDLAEVSMSEALQHDESVRYANWLKGHMNNLKTRYAVNGID